MKHETVMRMFQKRNEDKANGVKRGPLHTLQECCEAAEIEPRVFGRWAAQHAGAPQPVLETSQQSWQAKKKYYCKREFVQWVNQIRQQKEKAMPDIKTALQQALAKTATEWAADDTAHKQIEPQQEKAMTTETISVSVTDTSEADKRVTNNVSRTTFYYVRDNPGQTAAQVTTALMAAGFKATSVTSLIAQMLRMRLVMQDDNGGLTATVKEYIPIQSAPKAGRKKPAAPVQKRKYVKLVNPKTGEVLNPQHAPAPTPAPTSFATPDKWTVDSVIGHLNVRQAMAVYMELKAIFGE